MFIARFFLGFGIGPKSATTPIFAAECSPPKLRGALTMQWQMWTAFGIMVGYVADLAFYFVSDPVRWAIWDVPQYIRLSNYSRQMVPAPVTYIRD